MPGPENIDSASLVLAGFILAVAGGLGWLEWRGRRGRGEALPPEDVRHYRTQDRRRIFGLVVLVLLAVGVVVGSRLPPLAGRHANSDFVATWLGVSALVMTLLYLALADWVETRRFAGRHRKAIFRERIDLLRRDLGARDGDDFT